MYGRTYRYAYISFSIFSYFMEQHFAQAKVTIRKQIAVSKKVQKKLGGLEEGDYLLFYEDNERIYIKKGVIVPEK